MSANDLVEAEERVTRIKESIDIISTELLQVEKELSAYDGTDEGKREISDKATKLQNDKTKYMKDLRQEQDFIKNLSEALIPDPTISQNRTQNQNLVAQPGTLPKLVRNTFISEDSLRQFNNYTTLSDQIVTPTAPSTSAEVTPDMDTSENARNLQTNIPLPEAYGGTLKTVNNILDGVTNQTVNKTVDVGVADTTVDTGSTSSSTGNDVTLAAIHAMAEKCRTFEHKCIFPHTNQDPFCTGTSYKMLDMLPMCEDHLLSIYGISFTSKLVKRIDKTTCSQYKVKEGPYGVANSVCNNKIAFYAHEVIFNKGYQGGILNLLTSSIHDMRQNMSLNPHVVNVMYYLFDKNTKSMDACDISKIFRNMTCDDFSIKMLASLVAMELWGFRAGKITVTQYVFEMTSPEFSQAVAILLERLYRFTNRVFNMFGVTPFTSLLLTISDYNAVDHFMDQDANMVDVEFSLVAARNICNKEQLFMRFQSNIEKNKFEVFKAVNYSGKNSALGFGGKFCSPSFTKNRDCPLPYAKSLSFVEPIRMGADIIKGCTGIISSLDYNNL
jgi:hypothetical protein